MLFFKQKSKEKGIIIDEKRARETSPGHVTVEQIHNEFDTAPERLLKVANEIIGNKSKVKGTFEEFRTRYERLKKLGFTSTPKAKLLKEGKEAHQEDVHHLELASREVENILYYKRTYPFLKFITEPELDRICEKYGLCYAPVDRFIKEVPEKNLEEIEGAKGLLQGDDPLPYADVSKCSLSGYGWDITKRLFPDMKVPLKNRTVFGDITLKYHNSFLYLNIPGREDVDYRGAKIYNKQGLFIAAPEEDFDLEGLDREGKGFYESHTVVKDPVVFRYVRGGVQVLTKWGGEADDPALQVGINN